MIYVSIVLAVVLAATAVVWRWRSVDYAEERAAALQDAVAVLQAALSASEGRLADASDRELKLTATVKSMKGAATAAEAATKKRTGKPADARADARRKR
jgi:hypothetical protein